MTELACLADL